MSNFSISDAVVSCKLATEDSLSASQLTLSCTLQSFFTEAASCSALFSLAVGQGFAAVVQAQGFRLLSPLFNPKMSRILSTSASWITEGVAFNTASELGRSGEFRIGPLTENIHGIATIAVCKVMGKGILAHNAMVRNLVQNSALMTVDVTFEECGFVEKRNFSLTERFFNCQLTSWRMEISASFLTTACPQISIFKAEQELDYELRKPTLHQRGSEGKKRFFDPLQEILAPALAGNNGIIIRKSNSPQSLDPILSKARILKMSTLGDEQDSVKAGLKPTEPMRDPQERINKKLKDLIQQVGLDPDTPAGQFGLEILSRRMNQGEMVILLEKDFGKHSRIILENALSVDFSSENGKKLALLILASADKPLYNRVSTDLWFKWLNDAAQSTCGLELEKLEEAIELGMRYSSDEYRLEIQKVELALSRIQMLTSLFQEMEIPLTSIPSIAPLFYGTLCADVQKIDAFNRLYIFWRFTSNFEVLPLLKKIGTTYEESSFWMGDLPEHSEDYQRIKELQGEVIYHPPLLDKDPDQRVQGAEILIRLKNQSGFHQTDLPRFIQLARAHADQLAPMTHLEETPTGHQLIISNKKIQFRVRILLEGKIDKIPSPPPNEFLEVDTQKHSRLRQSRIVQNLRRFFRWISFS